MNSLESFIQDVKFGLRSMLKSPTFSLICVLSLALGIGANTTSSRSECDPAEPPVADISSPVQIDIVDAKPW